MLSKIKANAKRLGADYDPKPDPHTDAFTVSLKHGYAVALALGEVEQLFDGIGDDELPAEVRRGSCLQTRRPILPACPAHLAP